MEENYKKYNCKVKLKVKIVSYWFHYDYLNLPKQGMLGNWKLSVLPALYDVSVVKLYSNVIPHSPPCLPLV